MSGEGLLLVLIGLAIWAMARRKKKPQGVLVIETWEVRRAPRVPQWIVTFGTLVVLFLFIWFIGQGS